MTEFLASTKYYTAIKVPKISWRSHLSIVFHNEIGDLIVE